MQILVETIQKLRMWSKRSQGSSRQNSMVNFQFRLDTAMVKIIYSMLQNIIALLESMLVEQMPFYQLVFRATLQMILHMTLLQQKHSSFQRDVLLNFMLQHFIMLHAVQMKMVSRQLLFFQRIRTFLWIKNMMCGKTNSSQRKTNGSSATKTAAQMKELTSVLLEKISPLNKTHKINFQEDKNYEQHPKSKSWYRGSKP